MWNLFDKLRRTPLATERFTELPPAPAGFRGAPVVVGDDLDAAVAACPAEALSASGRLDLTRCNMCGACVEACPGAVEQSTRYGLATRTKSDLTVWAAAPETEAAMAHLLGDTEAAARAAGEQIRAILGRSLHVRHVDAGSCNGCDWELTHLLNPVYDLQRFGIDFVASPRHADALLVTGGVTRHLEVALRRTWEAAGEPKMVVAIGTCATGGGMIGETYANHGGVDKIVPVTVYVPGCPPRPQAILEGLLLALGRVVGDKGHL